MAMYYGDNEWHEEASRLSNLIALLTKENQKLKERVRELSKKDELLAAEQSALILGCKGFQVKDLADRHGLKYSLIGNRRFYRRSVIEKLRDQLMQARG